MRVCKSKSVWMRILAGCALYYWQPGVGWGRMWEGGNAACITLYLGSTTGISEPRPVFWLLSSGFEVGGLQILPSEWRLFGVRFQPDVWRRSRNRGRPYGGHGNENRVRARSLRNRVDTIRMQLRRVTCAKDRNLEVIEEAYA